MTKLDPDEQHIVNLVLQDPDPFRIADLSGESWDSWSEWVEAHLHVCQRLFDQMRRLGAPQSQALEAVGLWLKESGNQAWTLQAQVIQDGTARMSLLPNGDPTPVEAVIELGEADADGTQELDPKALKALFSQVERRFLLCDPEAPVMVITYQEQADSSDLSLPDTRNMSWVAAESLYDTPPAERDQTMEQDTDESDGLRADAAAPKSAEEWEGMFWCRGELRPAGPTIHAARLSMQMDRALPANDSGKSPKIRM